MSLTKEAILRATDNGYQVFRHFLGSRFVKEGQAFKNPFYDDKKAACYVYRDKKSGIYKIKDFGDNRYFGDCFYLVGLIYNLKCNDRHEFYKILTLIDTQLFLNLESADQKSARVIPGSQGTVIRASEVPSVFDSMETANLKAPIQTRPFSAKELSFWSQYGINQSVLDRYQVIAISRFTGVGKEGKEYELFSSDAEPMFGYRGRKHTKIYRPCSKLRFLYAGEKTENYVFGFEQLPLRGDIIFITGGEKDVLSLAAHGFNAVSLNSETANIPKNLLRGLGFRFRHITILYDVDETGLASMDKIVREYKEFDIKSLRLPLTGEKINKDISDFFRDNHTAEDLMMLFREMLDQEYEETITLMRTCEIDFNRPPEAPEPLLSINEVTIGTAGNLVCVAGSEGSGKTNFLGGVLSGAIKPGEIDIDTLGTTIRENIRDRAVLLYDTEQSEYQLYKNMTYIVRRASLEKPPVWFKAFCLVGISRSERMKMILESMDRCYYEFGGIHLVVIDGIADLIAGVNEEEPSVMLVEELFRIAAIYNTVIICVLHLAPSGMKLRGHLGSEVQRKASGIILIEKEENINASTVKALKVRDGSPLDVPLMQFGWSKSEGMHIYLGEMSREASKTRKINELKDAAKDIFSGKTYISSKELKQGLMDVFEVQDRTARSYIQAMKDAEIIEKSSQFPGDFRLANKETG